MVISFVIESFVPLLINTLCLYYSGRLHPETLTTLSLRLPSPSCMTRRNDDMCRLDATLALGGVAQRVIVQLKYLLWHYGNRSKKDSME